MINRLVLACAAAVLAVGVACAAQGPAAAATASTAPSNSPSHSPSHSPSARTEAARMAAELTPSQAAYVQNRIDSALATNPGARQVSPNTLQLGPDRVSIAAPGQTAPAGDPWGDDPIQHICFPGDLCTGVYGGKRKDYTACGRVYLTNWLGKGWIVNNQYGSGATSIFYGKNGNKLFGMKIKTTKDPMNWDKIYSIHVCSY